MDEQINSVGPIIALVSAWAVVYLLLALLGNSGDSNRAKSKQMISRLIEYAGALCLVALSVWLSAMAYITCMAGNNLSNIILGIMYWVLSIVTMSFFCMTRAYRNMRVP